MNLCLLLLASTVAANLPILHLEQKGGQYFDLPVQLGSPPQELHLRLDVVQGDVWVPDALYFTPCNVATDVTTVESSTSTSTSTSSSSTDKQTTTTTSSSSSTLPPRQAARTTTSLSSSSSSSSDVTSTTSVEQTVAASAGTASSEATSSVSTSTHTNNCAAAGVYVSYGSLYSAYVNILKKLEVAYSDATMYFQTYLSTIYVKGIWFTDSLNVQVQEGNETDYLKIWDLPFVLANSSNVAVGGLALGSSQFMENVNTNFISNFVDNGLIDSNSYSLALSANNGTDPQLILGGVVGDLITDDGLSLYQFVEIDNQLTGKSSNNIPAFPIFGWGVTSSNTGQSVTFPSTYNDRMTISNYPKAAVLDSRHSYNYIPYSTLVEMAIELNAYYQADLNVWITDCAIADIGTIDMYLADNFTVKMPISNFIFPITVNNTGLVFEGGGKACALAFLPDFRIGFSVMGTPFLKSAYVAVDNDSAQIAIGNLQDLLADDNVTGSAKEAVVTQESSEEETSSENAMDKRDEAHITEQPQVQTTTTEEKDIVIGGGSSDDLTVTRSGRIVTVFGSTLTDYGYVFTESYDMPNGPNLVTTTFDGSYVYTYTNTERTVLVTAATTYSTDTVSLPTGATSTTYSSFLPISSGSIPLASTYSASTFTLTIPSSISFTDSIAAGSDVVISGGEVVFETTARIGVSSERDTTIYAFSSLVTSISKHTAGANSLSFNLLHSIWWVLGLICLI